MRGFGACGTCHSGPLFPIPWHKDHPFVHTPNKASGPLLVCC
jgi:hypothetical protein